MKAEEKPRVPVRLFARPLTSEPATDREPARDLKRLVCLAKVEVEPKEPGSPLARPLTSELARPNEPDRDLSSEL